MKPGVTDPAVGSGRSFARYSLIDALLHRRSRRFGCGMHLHGGPLAYDSSQPPRPLSVEEEAALAFAACGITGYALGELPYDSGDVPEADGGNIMINFVGRTVASGDASHTIIVFVMNDDGTWMLKRPQDYPRVEIPDLVKTAQAHAFVDLYEKARVRVADERCDVARAIPQMMSFNKWSANRVGTTTFLPVAELTGLAINVLLAAFSKEVGYYVLDERNRFQPAGLRKFARSRGGHLYDAPEAGRVATVGLGEGWLLEFAALEQGSILQNLGLMTQALGLGGFPYFAAHPFAWMQALGFKMEHLRFSRTIGAGRVMTYLLRALKRDITVPTAIGLEHGEAVIKPYCPPYYPSMREAVLAFVDTKYAPGQGTQRDGGMATGWRNGQQVQAGMPKPSDQAVEATIAYCDYLHERYGRFPSTTGPFCTVLAYQAHHLDLEFYDRFYRPEVLSPTQREHVHTWHAHSDEPGGAV